MSEGIYGRLVAPEIEKSAVQALMLKPYLWDDLRHLIGEHLFTDADVRCVFRAMRAVSETEERVSAEAVIRHIMDEGKTNEEASSLVNVLTNPVDTVNATNDIAFLAELALRRRMVELGMRMGMLSNDLHSDIADTIESTRREIDAAESRLLPAESGIIMLKDAFERVRDRVVENQFMEGQMAGTPVDFEQIDSRGGLLPSHLIVVGGRTSQGKTALATCMCVNAMRHKRRIAYYTLEMTAEEEGARIVASMTGISTSRILNQKLSNHEANMVWGAMQELDGTLMYFDERSVNTPEAIVRSVREMHRRYGIDGVVIDFLQRLSFPGPQNREQATADAVKRFKNVAKELGIWVMVLSQIKRAANELEPPTLAGLRDSGQIEEAADEIYLIHRPEVYGSSARFPKPYDGINPEGRALITIAKGRNTGTGDFLCRFDASTCSFTDLPSEALRDEDPFYTGGNEYNQTL